jgi:hypothetical protein
MNPVTRVTLAGLGRNKSLLSLSEKRITKAVRETLRRHWPNARIWVSCAASIEEGNWRGACGIEDAEYDYWIRTNSQEVVAELKATG